MYSIINHSLPSLAMKSSLVLIKEKVSGLKTGNIINYFFKLIFSAIIYYNTSLVSKTDSGMPNTTYLNNFDIFNKVLKKLK